MGQPRVFRLGLAGDTMLGRCVADHLLSGGRESNSRVRVEKDPTTRHHSLIFSDDVVDLAREADIMFLNLECCISEHNERWPNPQKPFFFRAPPMAVRELKLLNVQGVTLGNNHALDYAVEGLLDTLDHLKHTDIQVVGAGRSRDEARRPLVLRHQDFTLGIIGLSDHPEEFSATSDTPGIAYADLRHEGVPEWVGDTARRLQQDHACSAVMVTPHWGPNMCPRPLPYVRQAAAALHKCPHIHLIAGHSAHNIQGVWGEGRCVFDMGDLVDDYAVNDDVRNDLGLFFFVLFDRDTKRPFRVEAIPLKLEFCHTRLARGHEREWVKDRFTSMCGELGSTVREEEGRLVVDLS